MNNRASFIEIVTATFAAGESRLFALTGQYFELIDSTFPVDVTLSDFYGAQRGLMKAAEASFNLKNTEFGVIQITSASAQTIRFAYGTGEAGTRRAAGSVSIVGTVPVDLVTADVEALRRPELPTGNWRDSTGLTANVPLTIFAAGANPNGALIWSMEAMDQSTGTQVQVFIAKATAPANVSDGEVIAQSHVCARADTNNFCMIKREYPTRIAAGLGLHFISSAAGSAWFRNCRYSLL
ncbi:MAG: hypothetical protein U1E12_10210 [Hydrogenophaga sp.]|uniref:hypothetical protein n=1 Tax=Hydrogenophaga sp. TaxID=1904254 RepID=UPI002ABAC563|nr:hypothetical protein [Hydrogenophaga sp.]MDZ4102035.1 hypothetical protein [Hydrogenophaga sp.]